jgi:hypothetical protein
MNTDGPSTIARPLPRHPRLVVAALACLSTCSSVAEAPSAAAFAGARIDSHLRELLWLHSPDLLLVSDSGRGWLTVESRQADSYMERPYR